MKLDSITLLERKIITKENMKNRKRKHADGRKLEKNKSEITEAVEKTKHKIESITRKRKVAGGKQQIRN